MKKIWVLFPFFPSLVEVGKILKGNCKKQNLRFKSPTILEGSCTILESVKNEQNVQGLGSPTEWPSCFELFVAVVLIGHLELVSYAEKDM